MMNFEDLMRTLQGNLEGKINEINAKEQAIKEKEMEAEEVNKEIAKIDMNLQVLEVMKQELLDERTKQQGKQKEILLEVAELKQELNNNRLKQMLNKIETNPSDNEDSDNDFKSDK